MHTVCDNSTLEDRKDSNLTLSAHDFRVKQFYSLSEVKLSESDSGVHQFNAGGCKSCRASLRLVTDCLCSSGSLCPTSRLNALRVNLGVSHVLAAEKHLSPHDSLALLRLHSASPEGKRVWARHRRMRAPPMIGRGSLGLAANRWLRLGPP